MFWSFRTKQSNKHDMANILVRCLLGSTLTVTVTAYLSHLQRFSSVLPIARLLACLTVAILLAGNKGQGGGGGRSVVFGPHAASKQAHNSVVSCMYRIHTPTDM
jgi:hypothetical protein